MAGFVCGVGTATMIVIHVLIPGSIGSVLFINTTKEIEYTEYTPDYR